MARREQADSDLSKFNCPALLFGRRRPLGGVGLVHSNPRLSVGRAHKRRVAVPRLWRYLFPTAKKLRSRLNLLELDPVSTHRAWRRIRPSAYALRLSNCRL